LLSRRHFLSLTTATLAASSFAQSPETAALRLTNKKLATMPADFTGLSYENVQLYNPSFFSAENTALVQAYRALSPSGVLRLGGNLSDFARWNGPNGDFATAKQTAAIDHGKTYWEWKLTDQTVRQNKDGAITPAAIRNLRAFLDATNWRCIYGLNFGSGSPERAADEAAFVARTLGSRLIAFQLGNESDFWGGNPWFRQKPFTFADYYAGFQQFSTAIRQQTPTASFAGPDAANNSYWVQQFAEKQTALPRDQRAVLLSSHHYAMGPAKDPAMNAARLLGPDPGLEKQIAIVIKASAESAIPFRMTELNSCYGGGKPGVSDAFAAALWIADFSLHTAANSFAGLNLHAGGDGFYTPIETLDATVPSLRPLYFGMQFAQHFAGLDLLDAPFAPRANATAYAARSANTLKLALINKSETPIAIVLDKKLPNTPPTEALVLSAPSLDAKTGITFTAATPTRAITLAPYSAQLLTWHL
jgi:hypothetical protein